MTSEEIVSAAFFDQYAIQHVDELRMLVARLLKSPPTRVIEVGVAQGGSLYAWSQSATEDAVLVGVDLPKREVRHQDFEEYFDIRDTRGDRDQSAEVWSGAEGSEILPRLEEHKKDGQTIHLVIGNSLDPRVIQEAREALGGLADFAFIDGGHDLWTVRSDWLNYGSMVREGGLIAFHDIAPGGANDGVPLQWEEIREMFPVDFNEYVARSSPFGIGVLDVTDEVRHYLTHSI